MAGVVNCQNMTPIHYPCQRTQKIFWVSKPIVKTFNLRSLEMITRASSEEAKTHGPSCFELYQYGEYCTSTFCALWPLNLTDDVEQGKSEGFDSCDWPCNLAQIWSKSSIFQPVWPWNLMDDLGKTIGHLFYTTSSFVHHFKSISELILKLQSGNTQFGSKLAIFCPVWPWNFMDDLGKQ